MKPIIKIAIMAAAALGVPGLAAGTALASSATTTQVVSFDATGAQFPCSTGATYTVTGGSVLSIFHDSYDAAGGEHVTGTTAPNGVTLSDGTTGTVYELAGSSWFGGNFRLSNGKFEFTDTAFFNILGPSGGPVAKVAVVEHMSPEGSFSVSFGQCQEPND